MESELLTNGNHQENDALKPSKSVPSCENPPIVQNGKDESGSNGTVENGHDEYIESKNKNHITNKKEGTPRKESTPSKRELRPRESTPRRTPVKEGTPSKQEVKSKATIKPKQITSKTKQFSDKAEENSKTIEDSSEKIEKTEESNEENSGTKADKDEVLEGTESDTHEQVLEESSVVAVDETSKACKQTSQGGFFSSLLSPKKTTDSEKPCEATSSLSSAVCIESPVAETYDMNTDIKGRRAIKAFSRFPGRNVSLSPSRKRKGEDDSFDHKEKKRCTDHSESGSEKSPGWSFLSSPFQRFLSPSRKLNILVPTSTPLKKVSDNDSMAVNYNETSTQSITTEETERNYRCIIM